jgi:hypothetical protein
MQVVVPYTRVHDEVVEALEATGHPYEMVDVSENESSYYELLRAKWAAGETFIIVEHDIIVMRTTFTELEQCPEPWCIVPHRYLGWMHWGLGCVKFTDRLICAVPTAMEEVGSLEDEKHPPKHWCRLDCWLQQRVLPRYGFHSHNHEFALEHLGEGVAHGCL